ncbi:MAG: LacI family transcriptional regulator [Chloroflexi bacterium]|nr:LacI family transcriptional regulator [Chloroflexota bacterium]
MTRLKVTLHDVANLAQVSTATVSFVLNGTGKVSEATRQKVLAAVNHLGYIPDARARSLKSKRSNIISLLFSYSESSVTTSRYFRDITASVCAKASEHDYKVMVTLLARGKSLDEQVKEITHSGLSGGLIVPGPSPDEVNTLEQTLDHFPTMILSAVPQDPSLSYIDVDNRSGIARAVEHLANLGHRSIAYVTPIKTDSHAVQRLQGYREAMEAHGLGSEVRITEIPLQFENDAAFYPLLNSHPTAIIAFDDLRALQIHGFLTRQGLHVPDDMALIGFDDEDFGLHMSPRLTTIPQPFGQMGGLAVEKLIERVENPDLPPFHHIFPLQITLRESCGLAERIKL